MRTMHLIIHNFIANYHSNEIANEANTENHKIKGFKSIEKKLKRESCVLMMAGL